jgi:hypothetical protein
VGAVAPEPPQLPKEPEAVVPEPPELPTEPEAVAWSLKAVHPPGAERDERGGGHAELWVGSGQAPSLRRDQAAGVGLPKTLGV